jgi:hypothetical protein
MAGHLAPMSILLVAPEKEPRVPGKNTQDNSYRREEHPEDDASVNLFITQVISRET